MRKPRCTGPFNDFFFDNFDQGTHKSEVQKSWDLGGTILVLTVLVIISVRLIGVFL